MPASAAPIAWLVSSTAFDPEWYLNSFVAGQLPNRVLRSTITTTDWFGWACFVIAGTALIAAIWFIIWGNDTFRFLISVLSCLGAVMTTVALWMMGSRTGSEFFKLHGLKSFPSELSVRHTLWIVLAGLVALAALAILVSVIRRKSNRRS